MSTTDNTQSQSQEVDKSPQTNLTSTKELPQLTGQEKVNEKIAKETQNELTNNSPILLSKEQNKNKNNTKQEIQENNHKKILESFSQSLVAEMKSINEKLEKLIDEFTFLKEEVKTIKKSLESNVSLSKTTSSRTRSKSKPQPSINPIEYLSNYNKEALQQELNKQSKDELIKIISYYRIKQSKSLKNLDYTQLILEIIKYAERELNRGSKFLEDR